MIQPIQMPAEVQRILGTGHCKLCSKTLPRNAQSPLCDACEEVQRKAYKKS